MFWNSDGTSFSERDPRWVIASTAVAISVGVFANIFLLLRMMARGNPAFNQYMSIALWLLECIFQLSMANGSNHQFCYCWSVRSNCRE